MHSYYVRPKEEDIATITSYGLDFASAVWKGNIFAVQYHPEASPGPHDARYFFRRFREMVARRKAGELVSGAQIAMEP